MPLLHHGDHVVHVTPEQLPQGGPGGEGAVTRQARTKENKLGLRRLPRPETITDLCFSVSLSISYFLQYYSGIIVQLYNEGTLRTFGVIGGK